MSSKKRILVITDCADIASNELRATLVRELENIKKDNEVVVEPIVFVKEFSIINANFIARLLVDSYNPENLTILTIVNSLNTATKKRARIAGILNNGVKIVGANTGAFTWLIDDFGLKDLCETSRDGLKGEGFISFGGKYIHAPIAAKFSATDNIESVKSANFSINDLLRTNYQNGIALHIDNFGVTKFGTKSDDFNAKLGEQYTVFINDSPVGIATYCASMKELDKGELAIYKSSSLGLLEVGIVRKLETAKTLGIEVGDYIRLVKK